MCIKLSSALELDRSFILFEPGFLCTLLCTHLFSCSLLSSVLCLCHSIRTGSPSITCFRLPTNPKHLILSSLVECHSGLKVTCACDPRANRTELPQCRVSRPHGQVKVLASLLSMYLVFPRSHQA